MVLSKQSVRHIDIKLSSVSKHAPWQYLVATSMLCALTYMANGITFMPWSRSTQFVGHRRPPASTSSPYGTRQPFTTVPRHQYDTSGSGRIKPNEDDDLGAYPADGRTMIKELRLEDMNRDELNYAYQWLSKEWNDWEWFDLGQDLGLDGRKALAEALVRPTEESALARPQGMGDQDWLMMVTQMCSEEMNLDEWGNMGRFLGPSRRRAWARIVGMLRMIQIRHQDGKTFQPSWMTQVLQN